MKKLTVGRIVHYHVGDNDPDELKYNHAETLPAIVVTVFSDDCANLKVLPDGPAAAIWRTSVVQGGGRGQWSWPELVPEPVQASEAVG